MITLALAAAYSILGKTMVRYDDTLTSGEQLLRLRFRNFRVLVALVAVFLM